MSRFFFRVPGTLHFSRPRTGLLLFLRRLLQPLPGKGVYQASADLILPPPLFDVTCTDVRTFPALLSRHVELANILSEIFASVRRWKFLIPSPPSGQHDLYGDAPVRTMGVT